MKLILRRLAVPFACALAISLLFTGLISAHAQLVKSEPAPNSVLGTAPKQVQLFFDEDVDPDFSEIQVFDHSLTRVDDNDLNLAPGDTKQLTITLKPLSDGTYTAVWKVLSATDGHITRGNFAFSVGNAGGPVAAPIVTPPNGTGETDPLSIAVRGLNLLALLALVGAVLFRLALLERSLHALSFDEHAAAWPRTAWRRLALAAFLVALATHLASLLVEASIVGNVPLGGIMSGDVLSRTLLATRVGTLWIARSILLLALGATLFVQWYRVRVIAPLLGLGLLLTISLGGHSAATGGVVSLALVADWLHLAGVSLWVGGLFSFFTVLFALGPVGHSESRVRWLAWIVPQFSLMAIPTTVLIALTGLYNSLLEIPTLAALLTTVYGQALSLKVALFSVMVGFGAINLLLLTPRLKRAVMQPQPSSNASGRFALTLTAEVLLGASAIFLAGLLTLEPPARVSIEEQNAPNLASAPTGPQSTVLVDEAAPDVEVELALKPTLASPNEFDVYLTNPHIPAGQARPIGASGPSAPLSTGTPITNALRVILQFTLLDQDEGITTQTAQSRGEGHYIVTGNQLTLPGMWKLHVIVRRAGVEDVTVDFPVYMPPPEGANAASNPQAVALLKTSEAAMNQLQSLRSRQDLNDGSNGVVITDYEYHAPNAMRFNVRGQAASIAIGPAQYYQDSSGNWTERPRVDPFVFPQFNVAAQATDIQLGRAEVLNGENVQVIRYMIPDPSGGAGTQFAQWISDKDHRLRQLAMNAPSHFMMQYYSDYDSPQITISAPANAASEAPAAPAPASQGKQLYDTYCMACHGVTGHGDGPAGKNLPVQPFDLTTHVLLHDEQYLDAVITNGRGYMPAFGNMLSQDKIFEIIAYTIQLARDARQGGAPGFTPGASGGFTPQPGFTPDSGFPTPGTPSPTPASSRLDRTPL